MDGCGEISEGLRVVSEEAESARELEQSGNQVTEYDQLAGKSVYLGQECSQGRHTQSGLLSLKDGALHLKQQGNRARPMWPRKAADFST